MSKVVKYSFIERTTNPDIDKIDMTYPLMQDRRLVETDEFDEKTGRIVKKSEFRSINRHEEMKNYKVNDFCMENVLAVGIDQSFTTLSMSSLNIIDTLNLPNLNI